MTGTVRSPIAGPRRSVGHFARAALGLVAMVIAMSGLRLERLRGRLGRTWFLTWSATGLAYLFLVDPWGLFGGVAVSRSLALTYGAVVIPLYYLTLSQILGRGTGRVWRERFGEARAARFFEMLLGLGFLHQLAALGALSAVDSGSLFAWVHPDLARSAGVLLLVIGFGVKIWSTRLLGLDNYYYSDMFLGRALGPVEQEWKPRGPYRWSSHPMYGPGYLSAYGAALWAGSWIGFVAAAAAQLGVYLFCWRYETPFVERAYGAGSGAAIVPVPRQDVAATSASAAAVPDRSGQTSPERTAVC